MNYYLEGEERGQIQGFWLFIVYYAGLVSAPVFFAWNSETDWGWGAEAEDARGLGEQSVIFNQPANISVLWDTFNSSLSFPK